MGSRHLLPSLGLSQDDDHTHNHSTRTSRGRSEHLAASNTVSYHNNNPDSPSQTSKRYDSNVDTDVNKGLSHCICSQLQSHFDEQKPSLCHQLNAVERAQRKVGLSDLSSVQELHIHYLPIISSSSANPFSSVCRSQSSSDSHRTHVSKSQATPSTDKNSTMSHPGRRECSRSWDQSCDRSHKKSHRRSKHGHEKHGKHGKKMDPYLELLKQRWICYECGKIRSGRIRERHPLAVGQKMQPNWCGRCRISNEIKGKPLTWYGQPHYCWGCGIVRSEKYHSEHRISPGEASEPNYCRPCREASPGYERNLREASEVGSETTGFEKAFQRQVRDADLSDADEDISDHSDRPNRGSKNDACEELRKLKETTSSLLKNRSFKAKTSSDTSSEGMEPTKCSKQMHVEADKAVNLGGKAGGKGARLPAGSYRPPSVQTISGHSSAGAAETYHTPAGDTRCAAQVIEVNVNGDFAKQNTKTATMDKACQADISPTILAFPRECDTASSSTEVHQSDDSSRPTTAGSKDSGVSCNLHTDPLKAPAASLRCRSRRNPAVTSTGSPQERDGSVADGNIGEACHHDPFSSASATWQPINNSKCGLPSHGISGEPQGFDGMASGYSKGQTLSGIPMPPTPPLDTAALHTHAGHFQHKQPSYWESLATSPPNPVPNLPHRSASPNQPGRDGIPRGKGDFGQNFATEYSTRPDYPTEVPNGFNSAAHFSDAHCRRDFSGNSYYGQATENSYEYTAPYPGSGFSQPRQNYQYGQQAQYWHQAQNSSNGYPRQGAAFAHGGDFQPSAPTASSEFDFKGMGDSNEGKAAKDSFYSHVPSADEVQDYIRQTFMSADPRKSEYKKAPRTGPEWNLFDDGQGGTQEFDGPRASYQWRDDTTSVHHVNMAASSKTVTILSIHEVTSDEDLSGTAGGADADDNDDDDDASSSLTRRFAG